MLPSTMPTLETISRSRLQLAEAKALTRRLQVSEPQEGMRVRRGEQVLINFSSNDYLGLSRHPDVLNTARGALAPEAGAGASRLAGGNHGGYEALEARLAEIKQAEAARVFGSGYLANIGAIPALMGTNDLILADRLSHACMLDGAKLSGATVMRFAHNSVEHCRLLLEQQRGEYAHCLILTETIFSMDGDAAPLEELQVLAKEFDAWLMTDDAHGLGVVPQVPVADVRMGTLSKAIGSYGGYVAADTATMEWVTSSARSLLFSTALPPATVAASAKALEIMMQEPERGEKARAHARLFAEMLGLESPAAAIVPVVVGEAEDALRASTALEEEGIFAAAIRPPTVPPGTARLRFAFTALHTEEDVLQAVRAVEALSLVCA